jgi:hypothetical protein
MRNPKTRAKSAGKERTTTRFNPWAELFIFSSLLTLASCRSAPISQDGQDVSSADIEKYHEVKNAAKNQKLSTAVQENETGTDPRSFANQWSPFYRRTKLENGMTQYDLTANGVVSFNPRVGMFYEVPVAQHRDFSGVAGLPPGADPDATGMGDTNLKFIFKPAALEFSYGDKGERKGSVLFGTEFILPTATDEALAGNALVFSPILGIVLDMPLHGFIASINLFEFDVYKEDGAPETSRYVGRWFYMQPLTPPGPLWGGLYVLPELQPVYDFETDEFSLWVAPEFGKVMSPGQIAYIKTGWGIDNSEPTDRQSTLEIGWRWFF